MNSLVKENLERWLSSPVVSNADKEIIINMSDEQKDAAFFANIEFGTGGMRGILGPGTNCMNIFTVGRAMIGYGEYLLDSHPDSKERGVVISHDNRHMSREFSLLSAKILNALGIKAFLFDALRPTPELSFAVRKLDAVGGIMITASHNPKEYNGLKIYDSKGCQLTPEAIEPVLKKINALPDELSAQVRPIALIKGETIIIGSEIDDEYVSKIKSIQMNPNLDKRGFAIVYTPNHGTSYLNAMRIFSDLGYEVNPVLSQSDPDPDFSGTLSPNPEDENAYIEPIKLAKKINAKLVIMTDPDGDRCGLAYLDRDGEYKRLTGNESAAILLDYLLSERKKKGILPDNGVIYDTIVSSALSRKIASYYGVKVETFLTGFKYIGDRIGYYEDQKEGPIFQFGYEESYGCLIDPFVRDKDGIQAILLYSELALYYFRKGMTLGEAYEALEERFGYHKAETISIAFKGSEGKAQMDKILDSLRDIPLREVAGTRVSCIEDMKLSERIREDGRKEVLSLPKSNVLKFILADGSWIAVRPSGTEPKCKFYFEAVSNKKALSEAKLKALSDDLFKMLNL